MIAILRLKEFIYDRNAPNITVIPKGKRYLIISLPGLFYEPLINR